MALIWIVTTGNSDFKVDREDGFSHLRTENNQQLKPCQKSFPRLIKGDDKLFSLPARVMGILYSDTWDIHKAYFRFPLLAEFTRKLKDTGKSPDRIIVLLTNQEEIFLADSEDHRYDRTEDSPYWRDTCRLEPILKHFLDQEFGEGKVQFPFPLLEPKTRSEGLDNWDSTLNLVRKEFEKWGISENDQVIISHQASTPAISSAVQFVSLAKFGEKVDFLIGNERDTNLTRFLEGSQYLKEIRKREATTLLSRPDYPGVKALIEPYLKDDDTRRLLNAAIQWNFAEFEEFSKLIQHEIVAVNYSELVEKLRERTRQENWWWTAYESACLAIVRFRQDNFVEAVFHSFRSVEGLIKAWIESDFLIKDRKIASKEGVFCLKANNRHYNAFGKDLYYFLDRERTIREIEDEHIWKFGNFVFDRRNDLFHNLKGLRQLEDFRELQELTSREAVFKFWEISSNSEKEWIDRIMGCLNFISRQEYEFMNFSAKEQIAEEASLMAQVHQELERAIANL